MKPICISIILFCSLFLNATHKVYLLHGYGGLGIEMEKIRAAIDKEGYENEIYVYYSLVKDVDFVANDIFKKIQRENFDTVSFVTHSMGALVVRAMYEKFDSLTAFPFIHRIIMIAPPNNGSPVADYVVQFKFLKFIVGPNINNLTTNKITGAGKYPIPTCEVGLIAGSYGGKKGFNIFLEGDNDGVLIPQNTDMGIEKDIVFVKSSHIGLLFNNTVKKQVIQFLKHGKFYAKNS